MHLCGNANDTASWTATSVSSLLALSVATLSKIIGAGVHNNSAAEDALWADQLDQLVLDRALCVALAIGFEVSEVTDVALRILWSTVLLAVWVDCKNSQLYNLPCWPGWQVLRTMWAGAGAAVGVVAERVNVHATLSVGVVAGDVP